MTPNEPSSPRSAALPERETIGRVLALIAVARMVISGYGWRWTGSGELPTFAAMQMLESGLLLGLAIWIARPRVPLLAPTHSQAARAAVRWIPAALGIAALAAFTAINARADLPVVHHVQMALFAGGVLGVTWGFGGGRALLAPVAALRTRAARAELLPVVLITLLALALRLWKLGTAVHIMVDELHFMDAVMRLQDQNGTRLLSDIDSIANFTHIFPYVQMWTVRLFGPDLYGLRVVSAALGALTVPALYLLARALFDHRTALIAALLLAVLPPHLHFSRLALNNIADPLFGTLALAFLARGLRHNRPADYALAGAALGLAQYFYEGGRLVFSGVLLIWLALALIAWRPRAHLGGLLRLALVAGLVAAPLYVALLSTDRSLSARFDDKGAHWHTLKTLLAEEPLPQALHTFATTTLRPAALHLVYTPDTSQFYYGGRTALLLWYVTPLFLLGAFFALWRLRVPGLLPLLWVGAVIVGNGLLDRPDWSVRFVAVLPALALLAAIGLRHTLALVWPERWGVRSAGRVLAALAAACAVAQGAYYFGPHLDRYNVEFRGPRDFYDPLYRAAAYPPGTLLVYIGDDVIFWPVITSTVRFWSLDVQVAYLHPSELGTGALTGIERDRTVLFFVEPDDPRALETLRQNFVVRGPLWSVYNVPRERQYAMYVYEPPGVIAAAPR